MPVVALSFADPRGLVKRAKGAGAKTMCQVQTMEDAQKAVDAGADVLVAQGNEAGGHTGTMNLLPFLTRVIEAFPDVPVVAAGGIANGRGLAAVLAAGADGAWLGTVFLATPEAIEVLEGHKHRVVQSNGEDTLYTEVYDIIGGALWPRGIAGRVWRNTLAEEWHGREEELRQHRDELVGPTQEAHERGDIDRIPLHMGQSAAFVNAVRPAGEVLREICDDAERILRERSREVLG